MNIMLLYGGQSYEHEVSLRSASYLCNKLQELSHNIIPVAVHKNGQWTLTDIDLQFENIKKSNALYIPENNNIQEQQVWTIPSQGLWYNQNKPTHLNIDCVIIMIHGYGGEDGLIQSTLELAKVPYSGCNPVSSMVCMQKHIAKALCVLHQIPVLPFVAIPEFLFEKEQETYLKNCIETLSFPLIIKPSDGGSSVGVFTANNKEELRNNIIQCFQYTTVVLVEPLIKPIREIETSIVQKDRIYSFPPGEIYIPSHQVYDYNLKYIAQDQDIQLIIPANLDDSLSKKIIDLSERVFVQLHCEGFARIDFFLTDQNEVFVNEINTIPGFTSISMFPKIATQSMSDKELVQAMIDSGIEAFQKKRIPEINKS